MQASDTIEAIKRVIEEQEGVPPEDLRLTFAGERLHREKTLSDYKIPADSTLDLTTLSEQPRMQTFVKPTAGKTFVLDAEASDTLKNLKQKIHDKEGIPETEQRLAIDIKSRKNYDSDRLWDHEVQNGATLDLTTMGEYRGNMQIFVKTLTGKTITLDVASSDTIETVKQKIQSK